MKKILLILLLFISILFIFGCKNNEDTKETVWKTDPKDFQDPWVLQSDKPDKYGTYLGNGYLGIKPNEYGVPNVGPYMAGVYLDDNLVSVPNIFHLKFYTLNNNETCEFIIKKNYKQTLNMKKAELFTEYEGSANKKKANIKVTTKVLRLNDNSCKVLIKANITPKFNGTLGLVAPIEYDENNLKLQNQTFSIKGQSQTKNLHFRQNLTLYNNEGNTIIQKDNIYKPYEIDVNKNQNYEVCFLGELSKKSITPNLDLSKDLYNKIENEHYSNWAKLWESDIIIEGDSKAQQVSHSNIFYLLCSASKDYSIPPMGLSLNAFNGHTFWDAELWMFPALIWQYPDLARGIITYRIKTLTGAKENAKNNNMKGAEYPWESGETGLEKSPDPNTVFERHINGDIAFAIWQYYVITGDMNLLKEAYPVLTATADYWLSKVEKGAKGYEIRYVCPPDENAGIVNNSVFTNAICQINLWIATEAGKVLGFSPNPKYMEVANNIYIGHDNKKFIIYDDYKDGSIKQADPELLLYPLKYNEFVKKLDKKYDFNQEIFTNTYDFYKNKVVKNGPSMASSAHTVISARLKQDSIDDFTKSYEPYMRGQFNYFNEKKSLTYEYMCFLTGAGSSYASLLWGFGGLDADYYNNYNGDFTYSYNLPKNWKSLTLKNIKYKGKTYNLTYKDDKVTKDVVK